MPLAQQHNDPRCRPSRPSVVSRWSRRSGSAKLTATVCTLPLIALFLTVRAHSSFSLTAGITSCHPNLSFRGMAWMGWEYMLVTHSPCETTHPDETICRLRYTTVSGWGARHFTCSSVFRYPDIQASAEIPETQRSWWKQPMIRTLSTFPPCLWWYLPSRCSIAVTAQPVHHFFSSIQSNAPAVSSGELPLMGCVHKSTV